MVGNILRERAIALYDNYTHNGLDRRAFMAELTRLAGSAAAANALFLSIAASPAAAAIVAPDDKRLALRKGSYDLADGSSMTGYFASPKATKRKLPAIMVVHENRGLNAHIEDVARRLALAGYFVVAPDFLSSAGGTPADEDKARQMIGQFDIQKAVAQALATIAWLKSHQGTNGRAGVIGFCWGGALVNRVVVATSAALDAGVAYYGPAPDAAEAAKVRAPLLLHYAGNDARVNESGLRWADALQKAGRVVEMHSYPGVEHAFNNDTSAARYNKAAADLAWGRTLAFFKRHLVK